MMGASTPFYEFFIFLFLHHTEQKRFFVAKLLDYCTTRFGFVLQIPGVCKNRYRKIACLLRFQSQRCRKMA